MCLLEEVGIDASTAAQDLSCGLRSARRLLGSGLIDFDRNRPLLSCWLASLSGANLASGP
jgi:hypothetical protein